MTNEAPFHTTAFPWESIYLKEIKTLSYQGIITCICNLKHHSRAFRLLEQKKKALLIVTLWTLPDSLL